jgi:hypothetical protein
MCIVLKLCYEIPMTKRTRIAITTSPFGISVEEVEEPLDEGLSLADKISRNNADLAALREKRGDPKASPMRLRSGR